MENYPDVKIQYEIMEAREMVAYPHRARHPDPSCCERCYTDWKYEQVYHRRTMQVMPMYQIETTKINASTMALYDPPKGPDAKSAVLVKQINERENDMNVVKKLKNLSLDKGDRLLRKYGLVNETGDLTSEGQAVLWDIFLTEYKAKLVAKVTALEVAEKAKRSK